MFCPGRGKATAAIDAARARTSLLTTIRNDEDSLAAQRGDYVPRPLSPVEKANTEASEKQQKVVMDGIYTTPTPTPSENATWLEKAVSEVWKTRKALTEIHAGGFFCIQSHLNVVFIFRLNVKRRKSSLK